VLRIAKRHHTRNRCASLKKKPTAQIAHLVFCQHISQYRKTKRAVFLPTLNKQEIE